MVKRAQGMPGFIKPQLATLKGKAPSGTQWVHEIKYDG
jgi:bifunctional non-homologous end joining protein LigD